MNGRGANYEQFIAQRIQSFQRRFSCSGTKTYAAAAPNARADSYTGKAATSHFPERLRIRAIRNLDPEGQLHSRPVMQPSQPCPRCQSTNTICVETVFFDRSYWHCFVCRNTFDVLQQSQTRNGHVSDTQGPRR